MTREWKVGDRVRNKPELANLYDGTTWAEKLSKPRTGTVVEVPLAIRTSSDGHGTLFIKWDSLTGAPNDDERLWSRWMHSKHIEVLE